MEYKIESPESWWKALEENWQDLLDIVRRFVPMREVIPDAIAEQFNNPEKYKGRNAEEVLLEAKEEKNWPVVRKFLSAAWMDAPDKLWIHGIKCWYLFCDLLSEDWVFNEE